MFPKSIQGEHSNFLEKRRGVNCRLGAPSFLKVFQPRDRPPRGRERQKRLSRRRKKQLLPASRLWREIGIRAKVTRQEALPVKKKHRKEAHKLHTKRTRGDFAREVDQKKKRSRAWSFIWGGGGGSPASEKDSKLLRDDQTLKLMPGFGPLGIGERSRPRNRETRVSREKGTAHLENPDLKKGGTPPIRLIFISERKRPAEPLGKNMPRQSRKRKGASSASLRGRLARPEGKSRRFGGITVEDLRSGLRGGGLVEVL